VQASDLNDDALARVLDVLAAIKPEAVFSHLALKAVMLDDIPVSTLHADSTSLSVYGNYR